jgi:sugar/nucleoside kinase (ribokinase family)
MTKLTKGIGVVGSTTIDKIVSQNQSVTKIGGTTTYAGITYSRHELYVFIISNIAPNERIIIDRLEQNNIIVLNGETNRTTHFINDIKKDSRKQEVFNRARPIQLRQLVTVVEGIDGLHLGPLHPDDIEPEVLTALQNTDLKIFLDVQGYTRKVVNKKVLTAVSRHLSAALSAAHIIKANGTELKSILDYYQKSLAELMKDFKIEESVITLGQDGGWVEKQSGDKFHYKADKIESVTDPTGAGDVFFASYIISRFANNRNIPDACRYAAHIAARQVEGKYLTIDSLVLP